MYLARRQYAEAPGIGRHRRTEFGHQGLFYEAAFDSAEAWPLTEELAITVASFSIFCGLRRSRKAFYRNVTRTARSVSYPQMGHVRTPNAALAVLY